MEVLAAATLDQTWALAAGLLALPCLLVAAQGQLGPQVLRLSQQEVLQRAPLLLLLLARQRCAAGSLTSELDQP
jgi:hypothetical protein